MNNYQLLIDALNRFAVGYNTTATTSVTTSASASMTTALSTFTTATGVGATGDRMSTMMRIALLDNGDQSLSSEMQLAEVAQVMYYTLSIHLTH